MRLLVTTQAVDRADPALGFFHRWIEELAARCDAVTVICLREGEHALPANVRVVSLRSRGKLSRVATAWLFLRLIVSMRNAYDAVFVHMNQEYILLGGWLWALLGKRVYMWRNHYAGSLATTIAALFCTKIFCTSKYSYTARYAKTVRMPVGIDTVFFAPVPAVTRDVRSILFLSRIAPSKQVDVFIDAVALLRKKGIPYSAHIYGSPAPDDEHYATGLQKKAAELGLGSTLTFHPGVPNNKTPAIYSGHGIFVNCSTSGMYDKTIFEAAACDSLVLASSHDFAAVADPMLTFSERDSVSLANVLEGLLSLGEVERKALLARLHALVESNSLHLLGSRLMQEMQP